jgi:hypothetical protein
MYELERKISYVVQGIILVQLENSMKRTNALFGNMPKQVHELLLCFRWLNTIYVLHVQNKLYKRNLSRITLGYFTLCLIMY